MNLAHIIFEWAAYFCFFILGVFYIYQYYLKQMRPAFPVTWVTIILLVAMGLSSSVLVTSGLIIKFGV